MPDLLQGLNLLDPTSLDPRARFLWIVFLFEPCPRPWQAAGAAKRPRTSRRRQCAAELLEDALERRLRERFKLFLFSLCRKRLFAEAVFGISLTSL